MANVIHFTHSGGEHLTFNNKYKFYSNLKYSKKIKKCLENGFMPWNDSPNHARKFMNVIGDYIDNKGQAHYQENIAFWGEWEQESYIKPLTTCEQDYPQFLQTPYCANDIVTQMLKDKTNKLDADVCIDKYTGKQNTDPYVFGDKFYYSCCKQRKTKGLSKGDIIIFYSAKGSSKKNNFRCLIDTVFVVGGYIKNDIVYKDNIENLRDELSVEYMNGVILPICYGNGASLDTTIKNTLYYGATYDNPVNGMYSFFPCKDWSSENTQGFKRFESVNIGEKDYKSENYFNFAINTCRVIKKMVLQMEQKKVFLNIGMS
jgi:hypothetical protein